MNVDTRGKALRLHGENIQMWPPHDSHFSHKLVHHNSCGGPANAKADNHLATVLDVLFFFEI